MLTTSKVLFFSLDRSIFIAVLCDESATTNHITFSGERNATEIMTKQQYDTSHAEECRQVLWVQRVPRCRGCTENVITTVHLYTTTDSFIYTNFL